MVHALCADELYRFFHSGDEETRALRGVSLSVEAGETVAIVGPSGSGKSTLLHCLAGIDDPDGGMVTVADRPISRRPEPERARLRAEHIGVLFQAENLIEHLTVEHNVLLAQRLAGRADRSRCRELLEELGIDHRRHARPSELSGGQAQRAGLAVAVANDPAVLLADEPTGEVDLDTGQRIIDLLRSRAERGAAVVVVTHSPAVADATDRTIRLTDGVVAS